MGPKCPRCRADVLVLGSWLTTSRDVGQKANNNKTTAVKINLKHRGTKNKGTEGQLLYILYSDCVQGYVLYILEVITIYNHCTIRGQIYDSHELNHQDNVKGIRISQNRGTKISLPYQPTQGLEE